MKKEEFKKLPYEAPACTVIPMQTEGFICLSVVPKVPGSTEEEWNEENENGGELEL